MSLVSPSCIERENNLDGSSNSLCKRGKNASMIAETFIKSFFVNIDDGLSLLKIWIIPILLDCGSLIGWKITEEIFLSDGEGVDF